MNSREAVNGRIYFVASGTISLLAGPRRDAHAMRFDFYMAAYAPSTFIRDTSRRRTTLA